MSNSLTQLVPVLDGSNYPQWVDLMKAYLQQQEVWLVVEPPEADSLVWDSTAYITDLSNGPTKIEYVFPPGSRFLVLSVEPALPITIIRLRVHSVSTPLSEGTEALRHTNKRFNPTMARSAWAAIATFDKLLVQDEPSIEHVKRHRYSGRRCRCVVKSE